MFSIMYNFDLNYCFQKSTGRRNKIEVQKITVIRPKKIMNKRVRIKGQTKLKSNIKKITMRKRKPQKVIFIYRLPLHRVTALCV